MRKRITRNWSIIRITRLVVGIIGTVQGVLIREFAMSLLSFLLVYMALSDVEWENAYEVELKEANSRLNEAKYEKVDRVL